MNIYKCPNCKTFIDTKEIYRGIYRWSWVTKVKCKECGVTLKQKCSTMIYTWFVFGFFAYISTYQGSMWFVYSAILFLFLFYLMLTGKIFEIDKEENT